MKKERQQILILVFALFLNGFIFPAAGQVEQTPHLRILNIDDSGFPSIRMESMIFDMDLLMWQQLDRDRLKLMQGEDTLFISKLGKEHTFDSLFVYFLMDNRMAPDLQRSIRDGFNQLNSRLPAHFKFKMLPIQELSDSLILYRKRSSLHFFLFLLQDCERLPIDPREMITRHYGTGNDLWFGIYDAGRSGNCLQNFQAIAQEQQPASLLFARNFERGPFYQEMMESVIVLWDSFYNLFFMAGPFRDLSADQEFTLIYASERQMTTASNIHSFPQETINRAFSDLYLGKAISLSEDQEFEKALRTLSDAYTKLPDEVFLETVKHIMTLWSVFLLSEESMDPRSLILMAEEDWGLDELEELWYRELKVVLLKDFFYKTAQNDENIKLSVLEQIYGIEPENQEFRKLYFFALGKNFLTSDNYSEAVEALLLVYESDGAPEDLDNHLLGSLRGLFRESYENSDYGRIYSVGNKLQRVFQGDFDMNYFFGYACRNMMDFNMAYQQYNWLLNNWKSSQRLIQWEDLLSSIEELSIQTRNFERALEMNMRIQRNNGQGEQIEKFLMNMRVKGYYPLSRLLAVSFSRAGFRQDLSHVDNSYPGEVPAGIRGIYVIDNDSRVLHTAYRRGNIAPPIIAKMGARQELILRTQNEDDMLAHLVQSIGPSRFLVIELGNDKSESNRYIMRGIEDRNLLDSSWETLKNAEMEETRKRTAVIFSRSLESEILNRLELQVLPYFSRVSGSGIEYLVFHNSDGGISNASGFSRVEAVYTGNDWERSSVAPAFFMQRIKYKEKELVDIAHPLFRNGSFYGVIRIGFSD